MGGLTPYYHDDHVTIYHGDCLEMLDGIEADVLITDPPYGRAWKRGDTNSRRGKSSDRHDGIANDLDTSARDAVLRWWADRPAAVFGDLTLPPPRRGEADTRLRQGPSCWVHWRRGRLPEER